MSERSRRKPIPARPPAEPGETKPTPARELSGRSAPSAPEADVAEVSLEVDDETWTVRVLGRSARASGATPPLLLLGFWEGDAEGGHARERLVVGRALTDLSPAALREALSTAGGPRDPDRKKPFFEGAGQARQRRRRGS